MPDAVEQLGEQEGHGDGGSKDSKGGQRRAQHTAQLIADEGGCDEDRAWGNLPQRQAIQEFALADPAMGLHHLALHDGNDGHAAAEADGADLEQRESELTYRRVRERRRHGGNDDAQGQRRDRQQTPGRGGGEVRGRRRALRRDYGECAQNQRHQGHEDGIDPDQQGDEGRQGDEHLDGSFQRLLPQLQGDVGDHADQQRLQAEEQLVHPRQIAAGKVGGREQQDQDKGRQHEAQGRQQGPRHTAQPVAHIGGEIHHDGARIELHHRQSLVGFLLGQPAAADHQHAQLLQDRHAIGGQADPEEGEKDAA